VPAIAVPAIAVPAIAVPVPRKRQAGPSGRFPLGTDYGFFVEGIDFAESYRENRIRRVVGFWRSERTVRPERTYG
jgi:hypothetical protein